MTDTSPKDIQPLSAPPRTEIRYLTPELCRIHLGSLGALHCTVKNEGVYGGVYAVYVFPVAHSDRYISLLQRRPEREDFEVGIIRDLGLFSEEEQRLIRRALARRYFIHTITRIHEIGWKYGFVFMDVDTDKGRVDFLMRWQIDRAVDYGEHGKVLIDANENRYLIPDVSKLSDSERTDFTRIIYW